MLFYLNGKIILSDYLIIWLENKIIFILFIIWINSNNFLKNNTFLFYEYIFVTWIQLHLQMLTNSNKKNKKLIHLNKITDR